MNKTIQKCDYLVFDVSSILYRTFFQNKNEDIIISTGLAHHMALMSMKKFYNKFTPRKKVIMTFDRPSWRLVYTESDNCISGRKYKGNRRQKMTPREKAKFAAFQEHIGEFEEIMRKHTGIMCLSAEGLEADDLVAGICEAFGTDGGDDIIIVSKDRDLAQLQGKDKDIFYTNIQQWDPSTGNQITIETAIQDLLKEKKPIPHELVNVDFFLFAKKLRGDKGDNVQSAYPGVRKTRIIKAWNDEFERVNLLNHTWKNEDKKEFIVKQLFDEGDLLMNLRSIHPQLNSIRLEALKTIFNEMQNPGKFSYFKFLKFLNDYEMDKITDSLESFIPLLNQ